VGRRDLVGELAVRPELTVIDRPEPIGDTGHERRRDIGRRSEQCDKHPSTTLVEVQEATAAALAGDARLVAGPVETPWRSLNARLDAPGGLHLTVFEEIDGPRQPTSWEFIP
jgi:hypothetical protein